ncbi:MAG: 4-hydroxy-3-methylbut-2-enyl diphosphate reductase [Mangrovibacterium sp.]|nr:4-hydroxy-3-methylbut-2-enyl diphosphate reductase [Mangrovibacterium sp.]
MKVEIDKRSGFCFGVTRAIKTVEETLDSGGHLYCLGDIVHNSEEVSRLEAMGLETIDYNKYFSLKKCKVLLRAHGEPPSTYEYARENQIELIDATCPIVLALQKRIRRAYRNMQEEQGQVIIYGKKGHAEVTGLAGQTGNQAIIVENEKDLDLVDQNKPAVLFSQTTKSPADFKRMADLLKSRLTGKAEVNDTICRQVSNRGPLLKRFAGQYDVIVFVGGAKSSNALHLFDVCRQVNSESHFVSSPGELDKSWFKGRETVGVCGATSTPEWLLEKVAATIRQI